MSALGGAWFPISLMPASSSSNSASSPSSIGSIGRLQRRPLGRTRASRKFFPILAILGGITAAVMSVAIWRFNRGKIFG